MRRLLRRFLILLSALLLLGGILSFHRHYQTGNPKGSPSTFEFVADDQLFGVWVYACPPGPFRPDVYRTLDLGVLTLNVAWRGGEWRASLGGRWWIWAVITGVPSVAGELLHRRRKRRAGFPIEPKGIPHMRGM